MKNLNTESRINDRMQNIFKDKTKDCKEVIKRCKIHSKLSRKYKSDLSSKKKSAKKQIKEINNIIKQIKKDKKNKSKKRCPNGSRKNRKSGICEKIE